MSLEQAIKDNTAAVAALTAAILKGAGNIPASTPAAATIPTSVGTAAKKPEAPPTSSTSAATTTSTDITYKDVAAAINAYVGKFPVPTGREQAVAKLAAFGLKTATAATPDQWAAIIEAFSA